MSVALDFIGSDTTSRRRSARRARQGAADRSRRGRRALKTLDNARFEVGFECTLWGTIKELRENVALVETGRLALGEIETAPLEQINDVAARLAHGEVAGRAIITP